MNDTVGLVRTASTGDPVLDIVLFINSNRFLKPLIDWNYFGMKNKKGEIYYDEETVRSTIEGIIADHSNEIIYALGTLFKAKPQPYEIVAIGNAIVDAYLSKAEAAGEIERVINAYKPDSYEDRRPEKNPGIYLTNLDRSEKAGDLRDLLTKLDKKEQLSEMSEIINVGRAEGDDPSTKYDPNKMIPDLLKFMMNKADKVSLQWLLSLATSKDVTYQGKPSAENPKGVYTYENEFYDIPAFQFLRDLHIKREAFEATEEEVAVIQIPPKDGNPAQIKRVPVGDPLTKKYKVIRTEKSERTTKDKGLFPTISKAIENMYANVMGEQKDFGSIMNRNDPVNWEFVDKSMMRGITSDFFKGLEEASDELAGTAETKERNIGLHTYTGTGAEGEQVGFNEMLDRTQVGKPGDEPAETGPSVADSDMVQSIRQNMIAGAVIPALKESINKIVNVKHMGQATVELIDPTWVSPTVYLQQIYPHVERAIRSAIDQLNPSDIETGYSVAGALIQIFEKPLASIQASAVMPNLKGALLNDILVSSLAHKFAAETIFQAGPKIQTALNRMEKTEKFRVRQDPAFAKNPEGAGRLVSQVMEELFALLSIK